MISNVFYVSAKRLQKLNGDDTLQNSLSMHASTDQRPTEHLLLPRRYLWQTFSGIIFSPKILCTSVFPPIMLLQKRGECEKVQGKRLWKYVAQKALSIQLTACEVFSLSYVTALVIWAFLPTAKTLKESQSYVWLKAGQAWAEKRETHYLVTAWNILSVDPDFTEHLLAAH